MSDLIRVSSVLRLLYPHGLDYIEQADLDRGTKLHFMTECWVNDILHGLPQSSITINEILPMIEWLVNNLVQFESTEERFEDNQLGLCGHVDMTGIWNGTPCVFDFKYAETISQQNHMQMLAYKHLTKRKPILLQCPKSGKVKAIHCKPDPYLWSAFLSGLNVLKFQQSFQPPQFTQAQIDKIKQEANALLCQIKN